MTCSQQHRGSPGSCLADDKASASARSTHILLLENLPTLKMKQSQPSVLRETAENHTTAQSERWEQSDFVQQGQEYYGAGFLQCTAPEPHPTSRTELRPAGISGENLPL